MENQKRKRYEFLVQRADKALETDFYMETIAIIYALFEERTYSLMDKLALPYNDQKIKLAGCIKAIKKAVNDRTVAIPTCNSRVDIHDFLNQGLFAGNLLNDIYDWRNTRNELVHNLAKYDIDYSYLKPFAEEGVRFFKEYTAFIMRFKKEFSIK